MKTAKACKLFGAHQALMGIKDAVVLFHSVVGCNYGTMSFHLAPCNMTDVRQTCTVISDNEIVFSGESSLKKALTYIRELYDPNAVFVVTGCVSDIIQDDVSYIASEFERESGIKTFCVEAPGYQGDICDGFEAALLVFASAMKEKEVRTEHTEKPQINIIGLGADDPRITFDVKAIKKLLGEKVELGVCFADCTMGEVERAANASLNLVIGKGVKLAEKMEQEFQIPYICIDYPYGRGGARKLWKVLEKQFGVDYSAEEAEFKDFITEELKRVYTYLQALYGVPVAVIGSRGRARAMADFLAEELGMEVEVLENREEADGLEEFYDKVRASEAALICGSSFEQELADELEVPLFRFDYPVFDRLCLSERPYAGKEGVLCLIEDILNELFIARKEKGALYQ